MSEKRENAKQPAQHQNVQPGLEEKMTPRPETNPLEKGTGKFNGKTVLISGGDSGIGKATALAFANEGANLALIYLNEHDDARETQKLIEEMGRECLLIDGDIGQESFCQKAVTRTMEKYDGIDVLINNAAEQHPQKKIEDVTAEQFEKTFRTNMFGSFFLTKAALKFMKKQSCILNTTSVTAYRGSAELLDYSATKGALVSFTRSLAAQLIEREIRVNAVAPGPVWTPLIPSTFDAQKVAQFGSDVPLKRAAQPNEIAPCYVFLASKEARFMTGQVLHPNGGVPVES